MKVELTNLALDDFLDATTLGGVAGGYNSEQDLDDLLEDLMSMNIEE